MRLRLVHTLSLLLLAVVTAAVVAFGGLLAWNLRSGFNDYLVARDTERLGRFAILVAQRIEQTGDIDALASGRIDIRDLLDEFSERQGVVPGTGPLPQDAAEPPAPRDTPPPARAGAEGLGRPPPGAAPPGRRPPPPPGAEGFGSRVGIYALDGQLLAGAPPGADRGGLIERQVIVGGRSVAWVRMRVVSPVPDKVESAFLKRQYLGIALIAGALLALGLVGARWMAGRWVRPLLAVQDATARIARGESGVRVGGERADEIGDLVRNVNQMAAALQRLESARRRWIAEISHELRTPLTVLRGEIDAITDGVRPLDAKALESLREEVLRLGSMVDDLHLLAMSDLESLPCHFADADAVQVLEGVRQRFEQRAADAGLELEFVSTAASPLPVHWDTQRIDQVLGNLLDNCLRHTDAPGRIRLALAGHDGGVVIDVDDSPPGVPDGDLPRLFEPLYRVQTARSRHDGGSGLGLAICEALVRAHGGTVEAMGSDLGGLRVRVHLPVSAGRKS